MTASPDSEPVAISSAALHIRLGYAPGVGKSSHLLLEAHLLARHGVDVVVGCLEHHGLPDVQMGLTGLEVMPPRVIHFRGLAINTLHVEAILARRPQLVVVDDAASSNPPVCRNRQRYQDVLEILQAGIAVLCAFDGYQLIRYGHQMDRLINARQGTIPEFFLRRATTVTLVDRPVHDLIQAFHQGWIHASQAASRTMERLYTPANLLTWRKTVLELLLELTDGHLRHQGTAGADQPDRVMVCLSATLRRHQALLHRGMLLAGYLNSPCFVVHVAPAMAPTRPVPGHQEVRLGEVMAVAQALGAEPVRLFDDDPASALFHFARSHGVRHLILGKSRQPWWRRFARDAVFHRLLNLAAELDIHAVAQDGGELSCDFAAN